MLIVENVSKYYGSYQALDRINFTVQSGEILGMLGRNGAGKSTLMRIMTGYFPASKGRVLLDNLEIHDQPYQVKRQLGYLPEHPPLYTDMLVVDYITYVAKLKGVERSELNHRVQSVLDATRIEDRKDDLIEHLSKGYRQRVGLAAALVNNPRLLVLDEPFVGLDPVQAADIKERILALRENRTIIFSSHVLHEVERLCDRVVIIEEGRLVGEGTTEEVRGELLSTQRLRIKVALGSVEATKTLLERNQFTIRRSSGQGDIVIEAKRDRELLKSVLKLLQQENIDIEEISRDEFGLEEVFRDLAAQRQQDRESLAHNP